MRETRPTDSIIELEKRVIKNPKKAKPEDLDVLARHYWDLATGTDDFREKRKRLKGKVDGTVCLDVPPGRYKACAYGFATSVGYESVIGVVTATPDEARNETKAVDSLF